MHGQVSCFLQPNPVICPRDPLFCWCILVLGVQYPGFGGWQFAAGFADRTADYLAFRALM